MTELPFNKRHFWRSVLRLGVPIALQNLLVNSFSMVDTIMVGQLGDIELSASGMAGQWGTMFMMVILGLCSGLSVFVAQYWGSDDRVNIRRMSGIACVIALLSSVLFTLPGLLAPGLIIRLFNREAVVVSAGVTYLRVAVWSYPGLALFNLLCTLLRSTESVVLPLVASGAATLGNIVFNYGLIFGHFGFPAMGILGAAIATVISTWLGPLLLLLVAGVRRNFLLTELREYLRFSRAQVAEFCRRAMPVIVNEAFWGLGTFLFGVIFSNLGYEYAAAVTIYKSVDSLMFSLFIGVCTACCILVGKSVGSGRTAQGVREANRFAILMPAVSIVICVLTVFCREPLIHLFNLQGKLSEETVRSAMSILLIYALEMPLRNNAYLMIVGVFRPAGDTRSAAFFDIGCEWLVSLPATCLAAYVFHLPFPVVFAGMLLFEDCTKVPLCFAHFFRKKWIRPVTPAGIKGAQRYFEERERRRAEKARR